MAKPKYQTRLEPGDAKLVDQYQADHDIGESETVSRLIRSGLKAEGYAGQPTVNLETTVIHTLYIAAAAFAVLAYTIGPALGFYTWALASVIFGGAMHIARWEVPKRAAAGLKQLRSREAPP